jgi:hypothetical protein
VPPRFVAGFLLLGATTKAMRSSRAFQTSHNRTVYAASVVAGLVFRSLGHSATLHSHAHSRHIWAARNPSGFFIVPPKRRKQPERYTT